MKLFAAILFFSFTVYAGKTDNQVEFKVDSEKISVTAKKGFHLNAEAPAYIAFDKTEVRATPALKTEKLFVFKKDAKAETANLSFYVCDDAKTVCEPHQHILGLKNQEVKKTKEKSEYNDIKEISLKSHDGRATLLVFSAPWCPACIRLQTETFPKAEVQKQISKTNFVKLNSDIAENYELSQKFKVKAIPTMILLDQNGQEAYRWLDFQSAADFSTSLAAQLKKVNKAEALLKNAEMGDVSAASTLAHRAYNTLDYAEAFKWFSLTKSEKDQKFKLAAEVALSQEKADADPKLSDEYLHTLQKAISLTTSKLDRIRWSLDYYDKKKELKTLSDEAKQKAEALVIEIDKLYKNPKSAAKEFLASTYGNYSGFEKEELLWMKGRLYKILDKAKDKAGTDKEIVALIARKKLSVTKPGEILNAIAYLREAGETKQVEALYEKLIKKYSNSYVYFEKYARYAKKNKEYEKALDLTNRALMFPQGNEPQLNLLKSQILNDMNKKSEALALINQTLKIENINHKRFSATLKRLSELKEEISK